MGSGRIKDILKRATKEGIIKSKILSKDDKAKVLKNFDKEEVWSIESALKPQKNDTKN